MRAHRDIRHASLLVAANLITIALPLISLPILARRVGVDAFGTIALAQCVGIVSVLFVDAGFNTESMRATGENEHLGRLQALLDNIIARSRIALPAATLTLLLGWLITPLPFALIAISLLQLIGTLLFAQWWLIACGKTGLLIAFQLFGRLIALAGIVFWVHDPSDLLLATALQCSATAVSGLLFFATMILPRAREFADLDHGAHIAYLQRVKPTIGPGFAASLSTYAPQLLLGATSGHQQVGLYAAAEKIVRAAIFAIGALDQALIAPVARRDREHKENARRFALNAVTTVFALSVTACMTLGMLAYTLMPHLFGDAFIASADIFIALCVWMPAYATRRAYVNLRISARADTIEAGRNQRVEAFATTICAAIGAAYGAALGAACGLIVAEIVCVLRLIVSLHTNKKMPI